MRTALLTTGLRPVPLAYGTLPGTPIGIVSWANREPFGWRRLLQEAPLLADAQARLRGRPYASLRRLCARSGLRYAAIDKRDGDRLAETLQDWAIDLVITSGCAMVPMKALRSVRHGGINLHPSPLPRYRGADPLLWQVLGGEAELGVTVHRLAQGSDTGEVLAQARVARPRAATREQLTLLTERDLGLPLLADTIRAIDDGRAQPQPRLQLQPATSPTPYARSVDLERLPELVPRDSLTEDALRDAIAFLGRCPAGWRPPPNGGSAATGASRQ